ncbi:MAG: hypothetical protein SGJ27_02770 [Candidatus Melainabacteria bacterium]|nr:hypothetical protein [Candidatus Melainabacteria bacterium]
MLTNLLALCVVILLSCPSAASARQIDVAPTGVVVSTPAKSAARVNQLGSGETSTAGTISSSSKKRKEATKLDNASTKESNRAGARSSAPAGQEGSDSRVLTARLKGSLCVSCLYQLEKKILEVEGVKSARVVRPPKNVGPDANERAYAKLQIIYLASKLNPKKIKKIVGQNDFGIKEENDVAMTDNFKPLVDPFEAERSRVIDVQFK